MKKRYIITSLSAGIGVVLVAGLLLFTRSQAHMLITQPVGSQRC